MSSGVASPDRPEGDEQRWTHVSRVLSKLDLRERTQAVVLAYESGLVVPRARDDASESTRT